jgi:hypothetical protein
MTHKELLARIKEGQWVDKDEMHLRSNALRAVVELHNPQSVSWATPGLKYCDQCSTWDKPNASKLKKYPCPTIQAIEKELS